MAILANRGVHRGFDVTIVSGAGVAIVSGVSIQSKEENEGDLALGAFGTIAFTAVIEDFLAFHADSGAKSAAGSH